MAQTQTLIDGTTRDSYTTKETAQFIRTALKTTFPGVKFSVTTSYASMTSSTHVRWTDGPTEPEVERVTNQFTSRGFDGMTDSTTYHEQEFEGRRVSFSGWVTLRRDFSAVLLEKAIGRFQTERASYGLPPARLTIEGSMPYLHIGGPDANLDAGVSPLGWTYRFRCCSDAVSSFAHHMRATGVVIRLKDAR